MYIITGNSTLIDCQATRSLLGQLVKDRILIRYLFRIYKRFSCVIKIVQPSYRIGLNSSSRRHTYHYRHHFCHQLIIKYNICIIVREVSDLD